MSDEHRRRRLILFSVILIVLAVMVVINTPRSKTTHVTTKNSNTFIVKRDQLLDELGKLAIKGRAPKTGYSRSQFGDGWVKKNGCDTREIILNRDLTEVSVDSSCNVTKGVLSDPYSGKVINFVRGSSTSSEVQVDHVVALSDAWQKGAQKMSLPDRITFANDPLELLAVGQTANGQKSDGDAATWLPPNKSFRCAYVGRQVAIKVKYNLWVTQAEHDIIKSILDKCPA
jgi:hypothetical protein